MNSTELFVVPRRVSFGRCEHENHRGWKSTALPPWTQPVAALSEEGWARLYYNYYHS